MPDIENPSGDSDLALAIRAAQAGARVGMRYFAALADLPQERKSDGSVVTEADRAVEAAIRQILTEARPHDAVLGEETGQTGTAGRRWIVDPIDGTALFVAGDDRWLVLIGLEEAGRITVGVAAVPAQGAIWWAQRGAGAVEAKMDATTISGQQRISVDRTRPDTLTGSRLGVIPTVHSGLSAPELDMIGPLVATAPDTPWRTHAGLLVASGDFDLAIQTRGEVWDFAATTLIVEEAGGTVTNLDGTTAVAPGPTLYAKSTTIADAALPLLNPPTQV